ncbi:MAG: four helix bundle protein [Saprospiraceae bacterium]
MKKTKVTCFEDLLIWEKSLSLSIKVYSELKNCRDYGLKDQMQRCSVSVPSNIAEGFERGTNKSFLYYLRISIGSLGELRTQLHIAKATGALRPDTADQFIIRTKQLSSMIYKLIQTRQSWDTKK